MSADFPRLIAISAFRDTFNLDPIKRGYYSIHALNPTRIVPLANSRGRRVEVEAPGGRQVEAQVGDRRAPAWPAAGHPKL